MNGWPLKSKLQFKKSYRPSLSLLKFNICNYRNARRCHYFICIPSSGTTRLSRRGNSYRNKPVQVNDSAAHQCDRLSELSAWKWALTLLTGQGSVHTVHCTTGKVGARTWWLRESHTEDPHPNLPQSSLHTLLYFARRNNCIFLKRSQGVIAKPSARSLARSQLAGSEQVMCEIQASWVRVQLPQAKLSAGRRLLSSKATLWCTHTLLIYKGSGGYGQTLPGVAGQTWDPGTGPQCLLPLAWIPVLPCG